MKYEDLPIEVKQIILDFVKSKNYGDYSTIDNIDYKFWEDCSHKDIAIGLAEIINDKNEEIEQLRKKLKFLSPIG